MESLKRILVALLGFAAMASADEIEFLNGSKLDGKVVAIHKPDREVELEAVIGGTKQVARYPYAKIHRVV